MDAIFSVLDKNERQQMYLCFNKMFEKLKEGIQR
jgi:hypothetical protein